MAAVKTPHASALRPRDRVVARVDLMGVPGGTGGKVTLVNGLSWTRYWVQFDNGTVMGLVDRAKLATADEWARRNDAPVAAAAVSPSSSDGAVGEVAAGGPTNAYGVPDHLLERSRKARERWAAKAAG